MQLSGSFWHFSFIVLTINSLVCLFQPWRSHFYTDIKNQQINDVYVTIFTFLNNGRENPSILNV